MRLVRFVWGENASILKLIVVIDISRPNFISFVIPEILDMFLLYFFVFFAAMIDLIL